MADGIARIADLNALRAWVKDGLHDLAVEMDHHLQALKAETNTKIASSLKDPIGTLSVRLVAMEQRLDRIDGELQTLSRRQTREALREMKADWKLMIWTGRWALVVIGTTLLTISIFEAVRYFVMRWYLGR